MANPPPPYSDITGISRTVMKDNAQETLGNYNGNARPGEIVADLTQDPPTLYIGNNLGQLTLVSSSGNSTYGNSNVATYLATGQVGNIIPSGNAVYSLGNATNQWSDLYVANSTIYLGGVPIGVTGTTLTVDGEPVLSNNGTSSITSTGNITANIGTFNNINTSGAISATGNVIGGRLTINGPGVVTGNLQIQGNLIYNNLTNITTANLVFGLANTVTGISANGAGFVAGNTNEASFLYNYSSQTWDSNIGINAVGNVTGSNIVTAGRVVATGNVAGGNVLTGGLVSATGNITGNYFIGNGSQLTGLPSGLSAFDGFQAPLSGNITASMAGEWIQAENTCTLPEYTTVPAGTVFFITALSNPTTLNVFNNTTDFFYYPPTYTNTTTRSIKLFQGQWIQVINRGTGEWDIIASNLGEIQKISTYTFNNTALALDLVSFRYDGTHTQFSPVSGSFTVAGQTIDMVPGQNSATATFASGTYTSGTWYNLSGLASITVAGSTSQSFLYATNGTYTRSYRATFMIVSSSNVYITIERLVGTA